MKSKSIFLTLILAGLLSSCSTFYNKNHTSSALSVNLVSNLEADVEVDMTKKITGSASAKKLFSLITISGPNQFADGIIYQPGATDGGFSFFGPGLAEEIKSAAVSNAMTTSKAEIIVAPQYTVKTKSVLFGLYKEVSVVVTGFAGSFKNIKAATK